MISILDVRGKNVKELSYDFFVRTQFEYEEINKSVKEILENVKKKGDAALFEYTAKFDGVELQNLQVTQDEIEEAYSSIDDDLKSALIKAEKNIRKFHEKQKHNSFMDNSKDGVIVGQIVRPIERVGIYVPGGTAAYPSTVIMNAVPAKIAGVEQIVMVTPPMKNGKVNPVILAAARVAGVDKIFKLGGAQSVAALSYGTESVPNVYKIVGPGNIYVAMAKKMVYGEVDIDMVAGPSEILVVADETANPKYVAADLLSQAEHDKLASSVMVTTSEALALEVQNEVKRQLGLLSRTEIARESIENYGKIILVDDMDSAFVISNTIAPEHLELMVENPFEVLNKVKNAGAIFMGKYSPEPLGDYFAGPNHTLPTSGTAKFSSPLSLDDFVKKSSLIYYSREALKEVKDDIVCIAENEGLDAHANTLKIRFED